MASNECVFSLSVVQPPDFGAMVEHCHVESFGIRSFTQRGVLIVNFVLEIEFNSDPLSDQHFHVGDELARTLEGRRGGFDFHN